MPRIKANNLTIEFETFGEPDAKPLLLVMGLGAQMIAWDENFCQQLADAGHFVIRYDNRDVGLSTYFDDHGVPDFKELAVELMTKGSVEVPYTLDDMAMDGISLLDELGIEQAHICGASLGGMIVQAMAINHGNRILSMTSIMSTTGNPDLPPAHPEAMEALTSERADDPQHAMNRAVEVSKIIGSTGFERDEERIRTKALESYDRAYYPDGVTRQMAAVMAHGDRRPGLNQLQLPCLVIHGDIDPLVPVTGAHDTHQNVPGAELMIIEGMGHDMPKGAWHQIVEGITSLTHQANATAPRGD
ncbi:MAG: alpha/beta fold hydrolase [Gammaproteobacteria bacterium]|jgi:pimeloyl-ACP methyl ester carboxylesterase|nr:alpha/beta fold hydrolase [Gammaproteobacteria bacterium]MBT5685135.1 alpha/beta fold hydrolase [Gammaproteobacteria bacterium]MBT5725760.1 alpha/beta fold hydrolase [Gammaproteobacteria bacterium]MBT6586148.1 alpha/beta fold hydrolase [Gammaproteobacteria bacterium]MBT6891420.1 alpha/beta fold hydrolase [Gammaproteobacteria bacterium]